MTTGCLVAVATHSNDYYYYFFFFFCGELFQVIFESFLAGDEILQSGIIHDDLFGSRLASSQFGSIVDVTTANQMSPT